MPSAKYDVPSRAEYYTSVQGPASDGIDVRRPGTALRPFTGDANDGRGELIATITIRADDGLDAAAKRSVGVTIGALQPRFRRRGRLDEGCAG